MDKRVFVNDQIFPSDGDYIIGGFETDKVEDFGFADFHDALRLRIEKLVDEYLQQATQFNSSLGIPNPEKKAREDLGLVINDNLKIEVPFFDTQTIVDTLMNDDRTQKWLFNVKWNIQYYDYETAPKLKGIYNQASQMSTEATSYKNAEYYTDDCTFEQFIEQLSSVEL